MLGVVCIAVGVAVFYFGFALATNRHEATDWWVDYTARQRDLFGRAVAPITYDRGKTKTLGGWTTFVGFLVIVGGFALLLT